MEMSGFAFTHLNEVPHMKSGQRNDCGSILASGQQPGRQLVQSARKHGSISLVGGEWFAMWQSQMWNGQQAAFRFYETLLGVLIYVGQPEPERCG